MAISVFFRCTGVHHFEPAIGVGEAFCDIVCGPFREVFSFKVGRKFFFGPRVNDVFLGEVAGGVGRRPVETGVELVVGHHVVGYVGSSALISTFASGTLIWL